MIGTHSISVHVARDWRRLDLLMDGLRILAMFDDDDSTPTTRALGCLLMLAVVGLLLGCVGFIVWGLGW